ncbi:MAG TPA: hypothetical protein VEY09_14930 [Pyrinomonadaceae bacterium]|nr:hypothetical protein [Pyrinomonadaceae bacterium]
MASRLTVVFYIILCLEAGFFLTVLPWVQWFGMGDWGNNFFLVYAAQQTGLVGLQRAVASGWVRGAVTGLGLLNIFMGVWELFHFRETVRRLEGADARAASHALPHTAAGRPAAQVRDDADSARAADHLSHHARRDD